ncbi:hypothetical protein IKH83_01405 [Candidatus Saccharibacteria bacterium]|nr:hypothetical protein [Candidatus Saccharibacteria bacterium]
MGKIVVVDKSGKIVDKKIREKVFEILRAALVPGVRDSENRRFVEMINDIKINEKISKKYKEPLSFYRSVKINDIRNLTIVFSYNPADEFFAKCQIFSSSEEGIDRLFCGFFSDSEKNPTQTTLSIEEMHQTSLWLPELNRIR